MKKLLVILLKIVIPVVILAYLGRDAYRNDAFSQLRDQSKDWGLLAAATAASSLAVVLTMVRWHYLVRALGLPFTLKEALRLGFLGYLFNFAPMGIVGGDLLKAVMLARRQPNYRHEALATVFVDRVVGLYLLFLVASVAMFASGFWRIDVAEIHGICKFTIGATLAGTAAMAAMLFSDMNRAWLIRLLGKFPYVGKSLEGSVRRLALAVQLYRHKPVVLVVSSLMSIAVHCSFSLSVYLIARGLYGAVPSLAMHLVLSPLSAATGVLPISIGPFELVLNYLYPYVPMGADAAMRPGQGLVVALGYRIICVLIAVVGIFYYLTSRAEVAEVLHEAEEEAETLDLDSPAIAESAAS